MIDTAARRWPQLTETGTLLGQLPGGGWKWHGAAIGGDGNIYGVPAHQKHVLKVVVGKDEVGLHRAPALHTDNPTF